MQNMGSYRTYGVKGVLLMLIVEISFYRVSFLLVFFSGAQRLVCTHILFWLQIRLFCPSFKTEDTRFFVTPSSAAWNPTFFSFKKSVFPVCSCVWYSPRPPAAGLWAKVCSCFLMVSNTWGVFMNPSVAIPLFLKAARPFSTTPALGDTSLEIQHLLIPV